MKKPKKKPLNSQIYCHLCVLASSLRNPLESFGHANIGTIWQQLATVLMDGHLTKTRGGKKGQIRWMVRFHFFSAVRVTTGPQFQRSIYLSSNRFEGSLSLSHLSEFGIMK
jgi:hypothetical protein